MAQLPNRISGFPEWLPEERRVEQQWIDTMRMVFESHGYASIEPAAVEEVSTIRAKGGDADKEIYTLGRLNAEDTTEEARLALHFDLTVPMARYVAQNYSKLTFPFKRYQIQKAWRGERPQEGRYREFMQADIDVIDNDKVSLHFDAEMPRLLYKIFNNLGLAKLQTNINNRKIIEGDYLGLGQTDTTRIIQIVDKIDKIGANGVRNALMSEAGLSSEHADKCLKLADIRTSSLDFGSRIAQLGVRHPLLDEGIEELTNVMNQLTDLPKDAVIANMAIARGLNYYTGTVYEGRFLEYPEFSTIFAGGRYENLIGTYMNRKLPGVGISIGITRMFGKLLKEGRIKVTTNSPTEVLVAHVPDADLVALNTQAEKLRQRGIYTEVFHEPVKIANQFKYAERKAIRYMLFVSTGTAEVKDLETGIQTEVDLTNWVPGQRKYKITKPC